MKIDKAKNLNDWFDKRIAINKVNKILSTEYWVPKNINFLWAMGMILMVTFIILIISGIFLLMYYKPDVNLAFDSVNYTIMSEVGFGWLWRHIHAVGASIIFLIMYIHIFTAIYYGSYKQGRELIWLTGMLLFVLFSAEAFSGYMLPWGQMSYWAGMVITNLFSAGSLELTGLVEWIRGDYIPSDAFLTRFFMLHVFLLPLVILIVIIVHFATLRVPHINNQDGEEIDFEESAKLYKTGKKKESKVIPFTPVVLSKDIFIMGIYFIIFSYCVFYGFTFAMDPINFDPANSLKTPAHIYPEWYFLWSYEILRPFSQNIGLIAFAFSQVAFFLIPFLDRSSNSIPANRRGLFGIWFWILIIDMIALTTVGKLPPTDFVFATIGLISAIVFFLLFITLPIITIFEKKIGDKNEKL